MWLFDKFYPACLDKKMKCVQSDQMTRVVGAILQGYEDGWDLALPSTCLGHIKFESH